MNPWDIFSWVAASCLSIAVIATTIGLVVAIFKTSNSNKEKN